MAKLLYSGTVSLDGFLAGPDGDMSWAAEHFGPNPMVDALIVDLGALLVGNRTFGGDDPYKGVEEREGKPFGGGWSGPQIVLTHNPPDRDLPDITFVTDLAAAVATARDAAGDGYVNVLGADVARQCLDAGELDEVMFLVAPVMLGDGVRILDRPGGAKVPLEPIRIEVLPHVTNMWLRVVS